jgi:uncharacterized protein YwqG
VKRDRDNLKQLIKQFGFEEFEDYFLQHARPSIRVETKRVRDESELAIGQSKMGGRPDLPPTTDWVKVHSHNGLVSLQFIAQFNLEDIKPFDVEQLLPNSGILYFFGDPSRAFEQINRGKVIFYNGDTSTLVRKPFPSDLPPTPPHSWGEHRYEPCSLTFVPELNLDFDYLDIECPEGKTWEDVYDLIEAASYSHPSPPFSSEVNRILGINHGIPSDMQLNCQLIMDRGSYYNASQKERQAAKQNKSDWQLLFQVSSDDNANMMWSDAGTICFYIRKQDLKVQNFNHVCLAFFTA